MFWMLLVGVEAWEIPIGWAHSYLGCIPHSVKLHNAKTRELSGQNGIYTPVKRVRPFLVKALI